MIRGIAPVVISNEEFFEQFKGKAVKEVATDEQGYVRNASLNLIF